MLGIVKAQGIIPIFLKSDNGIFKANKIRVLCVQRGIVQKFTSPYHSSSNGDAEKAFGDTRVMAMRMLAHSALSEALFWEQADQSALYTHNRIPFFADGGYQLPPIIQWEGSWPDYNIFRMWG
jgi:transposase InsO family protein